MVLWLPSKKQSTIPSYATHHCGVGAAILHENKLLVVRERKGASTVQSWKLPGGYVHAGEEFSDAAKREAYEETGITSEFISMLSIRHQHDILFGCSDLYIICRMKPLSYQIKVDDEIEDAKWMALQEFKDINQHPMLKTTIDLLSTDYMGFQESTMPTTRVGKKPFKLYHPKILS